MPVIFITRIDYMDDMESKFQGIDDQLQLRVERIGFLFRLLHKKSRKVNNSTEKRCVWGNNENR